MKNVRRNICSEGEKDEENYKINLSRNC
jgi:hypothetical protein